MKKQTSPIKIGGAVLAARVIERPIPHYPPLAKSARVQGRVQLLGVIARDGTVKNLVVLSGHPLLVTAALEAV
ncbi:MAG: energy transducer TonB, partial [Bryobacteraceae bacterium]